MRTGVRIEGCFLREIVDWETLVRALSEVFSMPLTEIDALDFERLDEPHAAVLVERHERQTGFRLDLTFYLGSSVQSGGTGIKLASRLAAVLKQDVLTSPPVGLDGVSPPPDAWVLARHDGALFLVRQLEPDSDDIEIDRDPARMTLISVPPGA
jgi:hypothetical protein